ncbi:Protein disulfide-isomerase A3 [Trichoplax sp. H2]|nr:Protein disulfide-isomerase A3 [Trichoplax sp. H2]|eukprot:RDD46269.1 Protein disulfide-isomerase A3 [Trichoplax sp. H2]
MLRFITLACLVFVTLAAASDVIELKTSNFNSVIAQQDITLVEFYAPWCGHCKNLAPQYESAATELKRNDPPVPLAKVDCTAESDLCGKYGVSGYPTLKIFRNGALSADYNGPREAKGIISYMQKQAGPSSKSIKTDEQLTAYLKKSTVATFVGFFAQEDDLSKAFLKSANSMRDTHRFAHTSETELMDKYGYRSAVVLFRSPLLKSKFEEQRVKYSGAASDDDLKDFYRKNSLGLAGVMTDNNKDQFEKPLVIAFYDVDYVKNPKGTNYYRNRIMKIAKEMSAGGVKLNYAIANKDEFPQDIEQFGASSSDDMVIGVRDESGKKFAMSDSFSMENFKEFLTKYSNGELKPYLKSEPVPASNDGPVKVVVASNFDEIVNDPNKDVLIEFYAPCSTQMLINFFIKQLSGNDHIVIAKMDATANDVPSSYDVQGFPTIYWAPANNKKSPARYEGGREVSDFVDYIKQRSTSTVKLGKKKKKSEL